MEIKERIEDTKRTFLPLIQKKSTEKKSQKKKPHNDGL